MRVLIAALVWAVLFAPTSLAQEADGEVRVQQLDPPASTVVVQFPEQLRVAIDGKVITDEVEPAREKPRWYEEWAWRVGFFGLAIAAMFSGWRNLNEAVEQEHDALDARSNQELARQVDAEAEEKLQTFIDLYTGEMKKEPPKNLFIRVGQWLSVPLLVLLLVSSLLVLGSLVVVPDEWTFFGFRFDLAKTAAWEVLNTNFASGFAATWIAILFFWGLQLRRRKEAEFKIGIAIKEARSALNLTRKDAFEEYRQVVSAVGHQVLEPPRRRKADDEADGDESYAEDVRLIRAEAIKRAIGDTPLSGSERLTTIQKETLRLKPFAPSTAYYLPWVKTKSLVDFIKLLRDQERLAPDEEMWEAIVRGDPDAITKLAAKLKSP